mmetsp:Transcript_14054/g.46875  ORF Transcript_14054/g.46875 Transcript_14054/m.46875 type:complete len:206 (+) Transcript_14054:357-974(+)
MRGSPVSSSSMFSTVGSAPAGRLAGFLFAAWYDRPDSLCTQRPQMRSSSSASSTIKATTIETASPVSESRASSARAWASVRGKPSRMKPFAQSAARMRSSMMPITSASETSSPRFITLSASTPTGVPSATAARSMSPVESCGVPSRSTTTGACVPLPDPGGPSMIVMTRAGAAEAAGASEKYRSATLPVSSNSQPISKRRRARRG